MPRYNIFLDKTFQGILFMEWFGIRWLKMRTFEARVKHTATCMCAVIGVHWAQVVKLNTSKMLIKMRL